MNRTLEELDAEVSRLSSLLDELRGPHLQLVERAVDPSGEINEGPHTEVVTAAVPPFAQSYAEWMAATSGLPPVVVDPGMARSDPCIKFELGDGVPPLVFQKGITGALDAEKQALYCAEGFHPVEISQDQRERLRQVRQAAVSCAETVAQEGTGPEGVNAYFNCLGAELLSKGL